jgi:glycogen debranching enzyme
MNEAEIADYKQKSAALKRNILKHLYHQDTNTFSYLIDQNGKPDNSQEGLGISFVVLFGIVDGPQANQLISHAVVSKFGITSIYPDFPRYSPDKPGRHNNIIWPMVNGFFAKAAIVAGNDIVFTNELNNLAHLALDEDKGNYDFREVYNPYSGQPDGGWQANGDKYPEYHWESCKLQTWSATAYISMVLNGIIGLRLNEQSLGITPYLPAGIDHIKLTSLVYRNAILNISIKGKGKIIKAFLVDGKQQKNHSINSSIKGKHTILIKVE